VERNDAGLVLAPPLAAVDLTTPVLFGSLLGLAIGAPATVLRYVSVRRLYHRPVEGADTGFWHAFVGRVGGSIALVLGTVGLARSVSRGRAGAAFLGAGVIVAVVANSAWGQEHSVFERASTSRSRRP